MTAKSLFVVVLLSTVTFSAFGQADSLLDLLNDDVVSSKKQEVAYTFKATRLINSSTVESLGMGVLDMRISHRFGRVNGGAKTFYGIDNATTRIGLDYGITKGIMIGIGHSVLNKENDGFIKVKLLKQRNGGMPITVSYTGAILVKTEEPVGIPADKEYFYSNRLSYMNQLLIARKFNDRISLQLMPTAVHINLVDSNKFDNTVIALGIGGRIKLSNRVAFTAEYFYRFTGTDNEVEGKKTYNALSFGFDIETGGHVFQLHFSNSTAISERAVIAGTTDTWSNGDMHYGFNISRVFTLVKPKEFRHKRS